METLGQLILQYEDFRNWVLVFAMFGVLSVLFLIVKIMWKICSGGVKLEATMTDKRQDKMITDQKNEIARLNSEIEKLNGISKEIEEIKKSINK